MNKKSQQFTTQKLAFKDQNCLELQLIKILLFSPNFHFGMINFIFRTKLPFPDRKFNFCLKNTKKNQDHFDWF